MGRFRVRHLVAKRQKSHVLFYWQPTRALRHAGFQPRRLAERTNDLADAIARPKRSTARSTTGAMATSRSPLSLAPCPGSSGFTWPTHAIPTSRPIRSSVTTKAWR
jgi:hypothetical protein